MVLTICETLLLTICVKCGRVKLSSKTIVDRKKRSIMGKDLKGKELGRGLGQRPDGRYEARATVNGTKINIYNMDLKELKKEFETAKAKLLRDEKNIRPNLTFGDWFDEWFEKCKSPQLKSETSRKSYYRKIKNSYYEILGAKKIEDITQINIQTATNELVSEKNYTERTVREALGIAKECFEIAIVNRIISVNPCVGVNIRNANEMKERRVLTHEEQNIFLREAAGTYYEEAYKFLLLTGVRIGEFSGLQWGDIDFVKKEIYIRRSMSTAYYDGKKVEELTTPKTHSAYRTIPFFDGTEDALRSWKVKQDMIKQKLGDKWRAKKEFGDLIWTSQQGSPVTRYVIVHDIKKVTQNINMKEFYNACREGREPVVMEHVHPHCFRHTFATRCFEKGLDPLFVQSIMGHSNYSTTLSYTHVLDEVKQREVAKAGKFLD